jgi:hypothetical protein
MEKELVAPCAMNCAISSGYFALKHDVKSKGIKMPYCKGCRPRNNSCAFLKKKCDLLLNDKVKFCYECEVFPCESLKHIDKRYRTFFRMSPIDNLRFVQKNGMSRFLEAQGKKWQCPKCGEAICCHNRICFNCGLDALKNKKELYR